MNTYMIKAEVLNMGLGRRIRWEALSAPSEQSAIEQFYKQYLTLEILEIHLQERGC